MARDNAESELLALRARGFRLRVTSMLGRGMPAHMMTGMMARMRAPVLAPGGSRAFRRRSLGRSAFARILCTDAAPMRDRPEYRQALVIRVGRLDFFAIVDRARSSVRDGRGGEQAHGGHDRENHDRNISQGFILFCAISEKAASERDQAYSEEIESTTSRLETVSRARSRRFFWPLRR